MVALILNHPESALLVLTRMTCLKNLCGRQRQCVSQDYPVEYSRHYGKFYTVEHVRGTLCGDGALSFHFPFSPSWDDALCIVIQVSEVSVLLWQLRQNRVDQQLPPCHTGTYVLRKLTFMNKDMDENQQKKIIIIISSSLTEFN